MRAIRCLTAISIACLATQAHAATTRIGTAAVIKNEVNGAVGAERRALKRGDGVFQDESIATGKDAGAQLLFQDETALTMGPESRVILNKLVYDPNKKAGEMTIRAVSGAFRFVTGSGPKAGYKIQTPVATIGVRGSILTIVVKTLLGQQGPITQVTLQVDEGGAYICGSSGQCAEVPAGYVVTVSGAQVGNSESKYKQQCGSSGSAHCYVNDGENTLYLDFLGRGPILNDLSPAAGPPTIIPPPPPGNGAPPPPGNGPPPPPPPQGGFSPIINPGVGTPPGLQQQLQAPGGSLPHGLQGRCGGGSCVQPGPATAPGRNK